MYLKVCMYVEFLSFQKWQKLKLLTWGNLPNFLLEVELLVFTNIQAISTLVCLMLGDNGFLMCNYSIIYNTCLNKVLYWKMTFSVTERKRKKKSLFKLKAFDITMSKLTKIHKLKLPINYSD